MIDEIVEAWRTNGRLNARWIDAISDEGMACTLSKRGGRDVVRQFAHLHNVRVWHLEKRAKALAKGLRVFETAERPDRKGLRAALDASGAAIERMLRGEAEAKLFKRGPVQTLAYFIAHESHHRGNIALTLKQSGHPIDRSVLMGSWDWDRI